MDSNNGYSLGQCLAAAFVDLMMTPGMALAQTARISGFVMDRTNRQALEEVIDLCADSCMDIIARILTKKDPYPILLRQCPLRVGGLL